MQNHRRDEIIYATLELASEKGLGTVSMQQIADKVGITKASLYNHFSSKDEIIDAMYTVIRNASKERASMGTIDYDAMVSKESMRDILLTAVNSYKILVKDSQLLMFYKIILSERPISPAASEIMVKETQKMIDATCRLFLALEKKGLAEFHDSDRAAFSFAMAIHSIIDYEFDLSTSGEKVDRDMIGDYIDEFCSIYSTKEGAING